MLSVLPILWQIVVGLVPVFIISEYTELIHPSDNVLPRIVPKAVAFSRPRFVGEDKVALSNYPLESSSGRKDAVAFLRCLQIGDIPMARCSRLSAHRKKTVTA